MKKILLTLCILIALISLFPAITAMAHATTRHMTPEEVPEEQYEAARRLRKLGLFQEITKNEDGTPNFALNYYTTRIEGVKILVRFTGQEYTAKNSNANSPFEDVRERDQSITGYAYTNSFIHGVTRTHLMPNRQVTADFFLTSALSILDYDCITDFDWCMAWNKTDSIGLTNNEFNEEFMNISRGEMAVILFRMLTMTPKGSDISFVDNLIENDIFTHLVEQQQVMSRKLYDAVKNGDKEEIRTVVMQIINGTDCNYSHCCCPICCEPPYIKPVRNQNNNTETGTNQENTNNTGNTGNANNTGNNGTTNNPPEDNKPDDDKETENNECGCKKCDCDENCGNHNDCHKCECSNCKDKECCNDNCCNNEDCIDCDCEECCCVDDCTDENGCNNPDCPNCNTGDNDCSSSDRCGNPDCPDCNTGSNDCDNPDGCGNPDCPNCNTGDNDCDNPDGCGNPDCPNCNTGSNDCDSPDGCGNPDCPNCNTGGNDCDSEDGCDDPDCSDCNPPIIIEPDTWPKSFLNVTDEGRETTFSSIAEWIKERDSSKLPTGADGEVIYKDAILTTSCYMFQQTGRVWEFDTENLYKTLSFTAYNTSAYTARIQVFDYDSKYLLWSYMLNTGESVYVENINISRTLNIEFLAELVNAPTSATHYENAIFICDPLVDREPEPDNDWLKLEGAYPFLSVTDTGLRTTSGNLSRWVKVVNRDELPKWYYHEAIKTDSLFMRQATRTVYTFDKEGVYKSLHFTVYNQSPYTAQIQIINYETKEEIWGVTLEAGTSTEATYVDISEANQIELSASLTNAPTAATHYFNAVYICNPLVLVEPINNIPDDCDNPDGCGNPDCPNCNDTGGNDSICKDCDGELCEDCGNCKDCGVCEHCLNCGGDLCDICGNCSDCEDCEHCLDCDGELCDFCGKCLDCGVCEHCPNCGGELCDFCGNCLDCETCEHCPDCGDELCDYCGKCLDCEDCEHCNNCNGELCVDCGECKECSTIPCPKCCRHTWGAWYDSGDLTSRDCTKCGYTDSHGHCLTDDAAHLQFVRVELIHSAPQIDGRIYSDFTLPENHPLYGLNVWENYPLRIPNYTVHADMYRCQKCWKAVYDTESAEEHILDGISHVFYSRTTYLRETTYDGFIEIMNQATEQWGNPDYCNEWSHNMYGSCINCSNSDLIVIGDCSVAACTKCRFGTWNYMFTYMIEISEWYETNENNESMCRSVIVCKKPLRANGTTLSFSERHLAVDWCNTLLFTKTKPHNIVGNTCVDCGYTVGGDICTDPYCTDPNCPVHGSGFHDMCFFCGGNERCSICNNCVICYTCRHCTDCDKRVWHNFNQYDSGFGDHWSIVPELIGDGTWDDIIEWLSDSQNFISCFNDKCSSCTTGQGNRITPTIKDWHERIFSNGFSVCYRSVSCTDCGDDAFVEAKVHNFVGGMCIDCGAVEN